MSESHHSQTSWLQRYLRSGRFFQYFHWLYLIVPLVSLFVAVALRADEKLVEFVILPVCLIVNLLLVWFKAVYEGHDELTPVRSLLTDKLLPDSSGKELAFNTEIAVIEDEKGQGEFCKQLNTRVRNRLSSKDKGNLVFRPVACDSSTEAEFKSKFETELTNAKAVVVVRTPDLEQKTAAYDAVEALAYKMSEAPILFTKLAPGESSGPSHVPNNFRSIPKDADTLPWRLLQRANERGSMWRAQAGFNGLIAANLIAFMIIGVTFAYYAYSLEKESNANVIKELYDAMETREQYQVLTNAARGETVSVSYWFRREDGLHGYVTTEHGRHLSYWPDDKTSIIGCAFAHQNHYAQWDASDPGNVHVWSYSHQEVKDAGCGMRSRDNEPIPSIVCASYNLPTLDPTYEVGICVFAGNGRHVVINDALSELLRTKAKGFHERTYERVKEHKKMVPLTERGA